jgi:hypothetical protein
MKFCDPGDTVTEFPENSRDPTRIESNPGDLDEVGSGTKIRVGMLFPFKERGRIFALQTHEGGMLPWTSD